MINKARTFGLVTLLAVAIWLFAEAESLGEYQGSARVQFVVGAQADRLVRPEGFAGSVEIEIRGSRAAIGRARDILGSGLRLSPQDSGLASATGRQTVDLLRVLQQHSPLTDTGVQIDSVRPQSVDVLVTVLEERTLPVAAAMPTVEVVGQVRVAPENARVRMPASLQPAPGAEPFRVLARPTPEMVRRLPSSGAARLADVPLELPDGLMREADITLIDRAATLEFTIRNRNAVKELTLVPVQVVVPPIELQRWRVIVNPEDQFVTVTLTGVADALETIGTATERPVAVLSLSSDELDARITSKEIEVFVLRGGVLSALPGGVQGEPSKGSVRFQIERVEP